jgi:hypothetical protein
MRPVGECLGGQPGQLGPAALGVPMSAGCFTDACMHACGADARFAPAAGGCTTLWGHSGEQRPTGGEVGDPVSRLGLCTVRPAHPPLAAPGPHRCHCWRGRPRPWKALFGYCSSSRC